LLDYLAAGDTVPEFLDQYPFAQPEQVAELLATLTTFNKIALECREYFYNP
jgi:uncharacterized protein (DUF433 family)